MQAVYLVLRVLFAWWVGQLAGVLPRSLLNSFAGPEDRLIVSVTAGSSAGRNDHVQLRLVRSQVASLLGSFPLDSAGSLAIKAAAAALDKDVEVVLEMPRERILEKRLILPLAVEQDLPRVLTFEMERETPFFAKEVYWSNIVEDRSRKLRQIVVRLLVVQKRRVEHLISLLGEAGLRPHALVTSTASIPIDDEQGAGGRSGANRFLFVAAGCMALAVIAVILPFVRQEIAISRTERRIATLQPAIDEAEKLRPRITGSLVRGGGSDEQENSAESLLLLADTTAALPDDTELTDLVLHHHVLELAGRSSAPDVLIERLASYSSFANPVFSAPVTKTENSDQRLFSIKVELRSPLL